jgi:hypothetical protein
MTTTTQATKRITRATFKAFIRKNRAGLMVRVNSTFDSMEDGVRPNGGAAFRPATETDQYSERTLGINGVWLVGHSDDYFRAYDDGAMVGIEYENCCGSGIIAIAKEV